MKDQLLEQELDRSAELYAELYEDDQESQAWVEAASADWPER